MFCSLNVLCHFNSCSVPDEFMYNPVTRSYGEPHKRPEVQNSTVEFIASSDYMVNTPLIHITRTLLLCPLEGSVVFSKQRGEKRRLMHKKGHLQRSYKNLLLLLLFSNLQGSLMFLFLFSCDLLSRRPTCLYSTCLTMLWKQDT